jgi:predicted Zn-dependent peptidase
VAAAEAVVAAAVAVVGTESPTPLGLIRSTTLDNGTIVLTDPVPGARSVAVGVWVGVGSRDEAVGSAGVCHFLEHLLFKGTDSRTALDVAREVERCGGDLDAYTAREHTAFHGRFPARHLDLAIDIIGDVLSKPRFDPADVELERDVILEELAGSLDVPEDEAAVLLYEQLFPDHGLGRETLGSEATISALSGDDIAAFFHREFCSDRMILTVAGACDHDDVVSMAAAALPERRSSGPVTRPTPMVRRDTRLVHRRPCEQGQLLMGWEGLANGSEDRHALAVLVQALGGGMSSRLFQRVREDRGLAYSVYAGSAGFEDSGSIVAGVATAPGRLPEAEEIVRREIADVRDRGLDADELATAIGFLSGSIELAAEDTGSRMVGAALGQLERGDPGSIDDELAAIAAVSADEVSGVAARLLHDDPVTVALRPG